jgi:hypothetical protein
MLSIIWTNLFSARLLLPQLPCPVTNQLRCFGRLRGALGSVSLFDSISVRLCHTAGRHCLLLQFWNIPCSVSLQSYSIKHAIWGSRHNWRTLSHYLKQQSPCRLQLSGCYHHAGIPRQTTSKARKPDRQPTGAGSRSQYHQNACKIMVSLGRSDQPAKCTESKPAQDKFRGGEYAVDSSLLTHSILCHDQV